MKIFGFLFLLFITGIGRDLYSLDCVNKAMGSLLTDNNILNPILSANDNQDTLIGILVEGTNKKKYLALTSQISDGHIGIMGHINSNYISAKKILWAGEIKFNRQVTPPQAIAANETAGLLSKKSAQIREINQYNTTKTSVNHLDDFLRQHYPQFLSTDFKTIKYEDGKTAHHFDKNAKDYSIFRHEMKNTFNNINTAHQHYIELGDAYKDLFIKIINKNKEKFSENALFFKKFYSIESTVFEDVIKYVNSISEGTIPEIINFSKALEQFEQLLRDK